MTQQYFTIEPAKIMHDTIDGEVVIVNLDNGYYYSLDNVGAQVWQLIDAGHSREAITAQLQHRYDGNEQFASDISAFVAKLQSEDLVSASDSGEEAAVELPEIPYAPPKLQKFTDMDNLLLIDPIHEVKEETGWPNTN